MKLGSDVSQDVTLGKITRLCLRWCQASSCATLLPLLTAPCLAGTLHMTCWERSLCVNILSKKQWSQKCKQPGKFKYSICNAGAFSLLNKLCKGISIILIEGIYVIWTLLSPPCQILILQTFPVAAVGEAAGGRSTLAFCLPSRRTVLQTL